MKRARADRKSRESVRRGEGDARGATAARRVCVLDGVLADGLRRGRCSGSQENVWQYSVGSMCAGVCMYAAARGESRAGARWVTMRRSLAACVVVVVVVAAAAAAGQGMAAGWCCSRSQRRSTTTGR